MGNNIFLFLDAFQKRVATVPGWEFLMDVYSDV